MTRFNLICHGMMLFVDREDMLSILIPTIDKHLYKFGSPQSLQGVCQVDLHDLPAGQFQLSGPTSSNRRLLDLVSSKDHLMLRQSAFASVSGSARNTIDIPMPDLVRLYRPVEVLDKTEIIFGGGPTEVALEVPVFLHDAVCFSYKLNDGTAVRIGDWFQVTPTSIGSTLCIYAQDDNLRGPEVPHPTGINDLLRPIAGGAAAFNLSRVGEADGAPEPAFETGVDRCQLRNLIELKQDISRTSRTGCTGAFLVGGRNG